MLTRPPLRIMSSGKESGAYNLNKAEHHRCIIGSVSHEEQLLVRPHKENYGIRFSKRLEESVKHSPQQPQGQLILTQ